MEKELQIITEEEFYKNEYCYELNDEKLSHEIEEYTEEIDGYICDITTQEEKDKIIEDSKKIKVYKRDYARISSGRIEQFIEDYFEDNYGCSYSDFDIVEQTGVRNLIEKISNKIEKSKCFYIAGELVGYIDLSKYVKEYFEEMGE